MFGQRSFSGQYSNEQNDCCRKTELNGFVNVNVFFWQALALPRTTILLLLFLTAFIWIAVILMLLLAVRLR